MFKRDSVTYSIDWLVLLLYFTLVIMGWFNIYGASYDLDHEGSMFNFDFRAGKQFVWIITAFVIGGVILLLDYRFFNYFAYYIYALTILLLIVTIFIAPEIKGSRSWLVMGPISIQPAELAKVSTALVIAKWMSRYNFKMKALRDFIPLIFFILLPFGLIVLQKEIGSALVFTTFLLVLYREGMKGEILLMLSLFIVLFIVVLKYSATPITNAEGTWGLVLAMGIVLISQFVYAYFVNHHKKESWILAGGVTLLSLISIVLNKWVTVNFDYVAIAITAATALYWLIIELIKRYKKYLFPAFMTLVAIGFCFTSDQIFNRVLEPHQQVRIKILLNMEDDLMGAGYNVNQSKIAIGSGGFWGKGFLNGTQTKLKYVPEQDTDFIFCTIGEEHGFVGSVLVLILYWWLLMRILSMAERQKEAFHRIYAYGVASLLFFHVMINVGMVLGVMPVIGIPLPFFSYGGSSLWSFTILLFILLRLDASRLERR
ncbi:MAG: Rod shape-determining protein RodA [Bacteroidetes bacterium ADurb.Bin174]|jgi:rod shape determining protein RodA|nr:MAG: Rod shape-determining protein RodA [Bacteroidetes bacterium ADurb.Bin174]